MLSYTNLYELSIFFSLRLDAFIYIYVANLFYDNSMTNVLIIVCTIVVLQMGCNI